MSRTILHINFSLNCAERSTKEISSEVAEVGDAFAVAEAVILDTLRQYGPDAKRLNEARKESNRQMNRLREQVGKK